MVYRSLILADDPPTPSTTPSSNQDPMRGIEPLIFMVLAFLGFYLFILRPANRRQEQDRLAIINGLKKNDRVLTIAGVYGVIVSVSETEDEVVVKVDDNCRLKMQKASISKNLTHEETQKLAREEKSKEGSSAAKKA